MCRCRNHHAGRHDLYLLEMFTKGTFFLLFFSVIMIVDACACVNVLTNRNTNYYPSTQSLLHVLFSPTKLRIAGLLAQCRSRNESVAICLLVLVLFLYIYISVRHTYIHVFSSVLRGRWNYSWVTMKRLSALVQNQTNN